MRTLTKVVLGLVTILSVSGCVTPQQHMLQAMMKTMGQTEEQFVDQVLTGKEAAAFVTIVEIGGAPDQPEERVYSVTLKNKALAVDGGCLEEVIYASHLKSVCPGNYNINELFYIKGRKKYVLKGFVTDFGAVSLKGGEVVYFGKYKLVRAKLSKAIAGSKNLYQVRLVYEDDTDDFKKVLVKKYPELAPHLTHRKLNGPNIIFQH